MSSLDDVILAQIWQSEGGPQQQGFYDSTVQYY